MQNRTRNGYIAILLSVLFNGASFHFAKVGVDLSSPATAVALACLCVPPALLLFGWASRLSGWGGSLGDVTLPGLGRAIKGRWRTLLGLAVFGGTGGLLFSYTNRLYGPTTMSFLANLRLVFLVLGGVLLGERLGRGEVVTIAVIVIGAFAFSYQGGGIRWQALWLMGVGGILATVKQFLAKGVVARGNPFAAMATITLVMGSWCLAAGLVTGTFVIPSPTALLYIVLGGLSGSMIGMGLLYIGYNLIGVARGAPLDALRPLVVLVIALCLGRALPGGVQVLGGACVLGGSVALRVLQTRRERKARIAET